MQQFDIIVIGTGSGLEVAATAQEQGLSAAVVEHGPFGGTCLNRGCIPSKILIHCADVAETVQRAGLFGVKATLQGVDWPFIMRRASEEIDLEAQAIEEGNRNAPNVTVFKGTGRFVGPKTLTVEGDEITAETVVIAAGTRPSVPAIPGLSEVPYLTSDEALRLPDQPRHLIIVGGGYIAAELAHFFGSLGTHVTIVHRGPLLLRSEDEDVARRFTQVYQRKFDLRLNATVVRACRGGSGVAVDISQGGQVSAVQADAILIATGRVPNSDLLDVSRTGVRVDDRGFIRVDEFLQTAVPGIWALGDIVGRYLLKHSANLEAYYVTRNILDPDRRVPVDYHAMPHAIFASPQVAGAGLTEQEAQRSGVPYITATYPYAQTAYGSSIEDRDGFVKVLAHRETDEVLGCHIIGSEASILIQEAVNVMRMRLPVHAITESIYVHPALPEVVQRAFASLPA